MADKEPTRWRQIAKLKAEGLRERIESLTEEPSDWAHLSPEESALRQKLFNGKRAEQEFNASGLGALYSVRYELTAALVAFWIAKRLGLIKQTLWAALAVFLYTQRAPPVVNTQLPRPFPYLPLLGSFLGVVEAMQSLAAFSLKVSRELGFQSFELIFPGGQRGIAVMDARDRVHILRDNWTNYTKNLHGHPGAFDEILAEFLGRGIFVIDGAEWREARKVASHMFSFGALRDQMQLVFERHGHHVVDSLEHRIVAKGDNVLDMQSLFQSLTFDSICDLAFGECPNAVDETIRGEGTPKFLMAFDCAQQVLTMRGIQPPVLWKLKRFFNIFDEAKAAHAIKVCRDYVSGVVQRRRQKGDAETRKDLLSLYIQHSKTSGLAYMSEDGYLMDVIFNFMLAGRDTTSCTLTNWIKLVYTAPNGPEIRARLEAEFRATGEDLSWDSVQNMPVANAVFNEVIRMYPPVAIDFRMVNENETLPSGIRVSTGDRVGFLIFATGRDPSVFERPDEFDPDRWLRKDPTTGGYAKVRRPQEYDLPVFWAGARLCLGKDMARFEVILMASLLMKRFNFVVRPHEELFQNGPVMFLQQGLVCQVEAR